MSGCSSTFSTSFVNALVFTADHPEPIPLAGVLPDGVHALLKHWLHCAIKSEPGSQLAQNLTAKSPRQSRNGKMIVTCDARDAVGSSAGH